MVPSRGFHKLNDGMTYSVKWETEEDKIEYKIYK